MVGVRESPRKRLGAGPLFVRVLPKPGGSKIICTKIGQGAFLGLF